MRKNKQIQNDSRLLFLFYIFSRIWISPRCPKIDSTVSGSSVNGGDSCTKFRADMIQYLATYPIQVSRAWIDIIRTVDCSEIKFVFIL